MHICILADGGPETGYGHLIRTSSLAQVALNRGNEVTYLTRTVDEVRSVCPPEASAIHVEVYDEAAEHLSNTKPDITVADSYDIGTELQRSISESSPLAVITDDTRFTLCCDMNINGNVYAPELDYDWIGEKPEMLLGTDYLLMRQEFHELADETPPWRDPPERALVTFGGSDVNNSTPDAVRAFDGFDLEVDVVIGPGFENEDEIRDAATETDADFNLLRDPDDLPRRMFEADFAVSATGSTVYELLATGTPVVTIPQSMNQYPILKALSSRDAIIPVTIELSGQGINSPTHSVSVCMNQDRVVSEVRECIENLTADSDLRRKLRNRGISLIDGKGTDRVYDTLERLALQS